MSEMNPATAATRVAIEFLTLFLEPDLQHAAAHIKVALDDPDGPDAASIIAGQCGLSMVLIVELAKARVRKTCASEPAKSSASCRGDSPSSGVLTRPPDPDRRRRGV
jgi:hypothetical protein